MGSVTKGNLSGKQAAIFEGRVLPGMSFIEKVWALTVRIPAGRVTTYGELARALDSRAYRAVGLAMNRNPHAPRVPCHRVVGSDGRLVGFAGGVPQKRNLLQSEGVRFQGERVVLCDHMFRFTSRLCVTKACQASIEGSAHP